jgi:hypothetical protein
MKYYKIAPEGFGDKLQQMIFLLLELLGVWTGILSKRGHGVFRLASSLAHRASVDELHFADHRRTAELSRSRN